MSDAVALRWARRRLEMRSLLAVVLLTALAVGAGIALRIAVVDTTRTVAADGLDVRVPAGWLVTDGVGDAVLSAYDPRQPDVRYTVERLTPPADVAIEDLAREHVSERTALLGGASIIEDGPANVGDVVTHRIHYTFSSVDDAGVATVIETVEDAFAGDGAVVIVRLEAPEAGFAAALADYEGFRGDVASAATAYGGTDLAVTLDALRVVARVPLGPSSALPPTATADLIAATVQVHTLQEAGNLASATGWGSGTIVSPDGLILTNAHVALPSADGLRIFDRDPFPARDPAEIVIAVIESEDRPAVPKYRATVVAADGYLDAAVLRIDRNLDGSPVSPGSLRLPTVPLGDSDPLRVGDALTVIGYPAIGGDTISLSRGEVSGFLGDDRIGSRAWVKTDAVVNSGNSGGLAADAAGAIVGIPTRANTQDTGGYSLVRPISLVAPMVQEAMAGRGSLDSRYVVRSTGNERMTLDTWTDEAQGCEAGSRVTSFPSATRQITALFDHAGFAASEDLVFQWRLDGDVVLRDGLRLSSDAPSGGCFSTAIWLDRGLPDGDYRVELFAGPDLQGVVSAQTTVGGAAAAAGSVSGRVIDVDSGAPIVGAVIYLLSPGTNPESWYYAPSGEQVVSYATTGHDGRFRLEGVAPNTTYPAIVLADDYLPTGGTIGPTAEGTTELALDIPLARAGL
jgi:putative serine protease PepD